MNRPSEQRSNGGQEHPAQVDEGTEDARDAEPHAQVVERAVKQGSKERSKHLVEGTEDARDAEPHAQVVERAVKQGSKKSGQIGVKRAVKAPG